MKKMLNCVVVLLLSASILGGCSQEKGANSQASASPTPTVEATDAGDTQTDDPGQTKVEVDTSVVDTYTFFDFNDASTLNWDNPVAKVITEKTGVALDVQLGMGDRAQRAALMLASDVLPDLLITETSEILRMMVDAKAIIPLDDLIKDYAPNLPQLYGDLFVRLRYRPEDPTIYTFGGGAPQSDPTAATYWQNAFFVQNIALINQNYPQVKSLEDFENVVKKELTDHPTTPDGQKRFGITLITSDGWRHWQSLTNPSYLAYGYPDNGEWRLNEEDNSVILHYRTPETKEYFRWLNKISNEGLLDPESFTQDYDTYKSKIASGRVIGLIDGFWEFFEPVYALRDAGKGEYCYTNFPVLQDPDTMVYRGNQFHGGVTNLGVAITKTCKNPEKVANFYNYLASDEGRILKEWGIEGVNYTVENGARVRNPEDVKDDMSSTTFVSRTGVKFYRGGNWAQGGSLDSQGNDIRSEDPQTFIDAYSQVERDVLAKYGVTNFVDMFPKFSSLPLRLGGAVSELQPTTEEGQLAYKKAEEYVLKDISIAVTESPDLFDQNWDLFMQHLTESNVELAEKEMTDLYRARLEFWKK